MYAYTVGPCIGGTVAGFFYLLLKPCHREQVGAESQNQSERSNSKSKMDFDDVDSNSNYRAPRGINDSKRSSNS